MTFPARAYALDRVLRARRYPVATDDLLEQLKCSRSTLHRTMNQMRDLFGAPIVNVPGRGYFYDRTAEAFELPGLWFGRGELEALLIMGHLLDAVQPGLLRGHIDPLRARLQQILDSGVPGKRSFPTHRIRILRSHARSVPADLFMPVATALIERRQLAFAYTGRASGVRTQRVVSPQRLVYYRDQWYLDAWDEDKADLRTFSIDRIGDAELLEIAARDLADDELDATLTAGYGVFSGPARHTARLIFTPERARWVADETWHPDQAARWLSDGSYELTVPYADERELVGEILRHGGGVRVVEPGALVAAVRRQLGAGLARYDSAP